MIVTIIVLVIFGIGFVAGWVCAARLLKTLDGLGTVHVPKDLDHSDHMKIVL